MDREVIESQKAFKAKQQEALVESQKEFRSQLEAKPEIAGFQVDSKQKEGLFNYITKPIGRTNKTQYMMDMEKDPDFRLKLAYFAYLGFDFSKIKEANKKEEIKSLRDKLANTDKLKSKSVDKDSPDAISVLKNKFKF